MNEVSCKVLDIFFRGLAQKRLPAEVLAKGTPYSVSHLRNKHERIDWDHFVRIMANAGKIWTREELITLGGLYFSAPYMRPFSVVARLLFSAREFYHWLFVKTNGPGDQNFSCVGHSYEEISPSQLKLTMKLNDGYAPCPEFFIVNIGNFRSMPKILGLPPAQVEMEISGGLVTYDVRLPSGGGWLGRVKKAVLWPLTVRAAAEELKDAHETLLSRYRELEQARAVLLDQAEQLQTVNDLGKELAKHTELDALGQAVMKLLSERFACSGAILWMIRHEGEAPMVVRRSGTIPDGPPKVFELLAGGHPLGRIDVWSYRQGKFGQGWFEFEDLLPWISIALDNARSFALLKEYQERLEQKVSERTAALKKSTEELEEYLYRVTEMDQQKTEFFSNASHELRTPLTLMLAPLESLVTRQGLPPEVVEDLRSIMRGGYRMMKLVNDLLDLSKLEAGKMKLRIGPMDLSLLLEEVVRPWRVALNKRGVTVEMALPACLLLTADAERLEQVALNLMSNAVKHVSDQGWIRVEASQGESEIGFSIANSGEGIDPEDLPRLFDRFAQSTRARSRRFGSTGLGLPVVRELVELHGGRIDVENQPGERVAFRVHLPMGKATDEVQTRDVPRPGATELRQYHVTSEPDVIPVPQEPELVGERPLLLIAEDNADLRSFLVRSLKSDFAILEAGDGRSALELAQQKRPEVILSDLMMPELDGLEVCKALKAQPETAGIPFILLTARGDMDSKLTGLLRGADDYLVKPFHIEEVRTRIRVQLRMRRLGQQLAHQEKLSALGTLVAGVAHEIRNPLNGILNSLIPLKEMLSSAGPEVEEMLDLALYGARRVDLISGQLLTQARSGEGVRSELDLSENISLALQMLAHKTAQGPQVTSKLPAGGLRVVAEPGALNQVWINLIDNAIQAAGPSGQVTVSVERVGEMAQVDVADDGPGIPPQVLGRIFDPFFTTKPVGSGTGLGLSLVREIIQQHGGDVTVHSRPGEGARFRVTLPASVSGRGEVHAQG